MNEANVACIENIYGFNWAGVGSREVGFEELEAFVHQDFTSKFSEEIGGREVAGVAGLRVFGEALEQDFAKFSYDALKYTSAGEDTVVVTGCINGVARASKMPLTGKFGHVWHLRDGKAARVEAYLDHDEALEAAGVEKS